MSGLKQSNCQRIYNTTALPEEFMVLRLFVHKQTIRVPSLYFQGASEQEERSREKGSQKVPSALSCVPNPIEFRV